MLSQRKTRSKVDVTVMAQDEAPGRRPLGPVQAVADTGRDGPRTAAIGVDGNLAEGPGRVTRASVRSRRLLPGFSAFGFACPGQS